MNKDIAPASCAECGGSLVVSVGEFTFCAKCKPFSGLACGPHKDWEPMREQLGATRERRAT